MKDPFFLSDTLRRRLMPEPTMSHRASVDAYDVLARMTRLAERPLDPIGQAVQAAESAACVIYVTVQAPQGPAQWTGSGFLLPDGIVVTANHVVAPEDNALQASVAVSFDGETDYPAEVLGGDKAVDIAVLKIDPRVPVRPVELSRELPAPGEIIATIGAPEGWANVVTVGRVSAVGMTPSTPPDPSWEDMMFIDADILEGSSGSMVIDVTGKVIGAVMGIIGKHAADYQTGQNAVVNVQRIQQVVEAVLSGSR